TYSGEPFAASATATGVGGGAVGGSFAFLYYVGSSAAGAGSSTPPTDAGTYTVVASFTSADGNYADAASDPVTFTIAPAAPTVTASADGGVYSGEPFAASATATGVSGSAVDGALTFLYYVGSSATGAGTSTPPTDAGTYTVVASFTSAAGT